MDTNRAPVVNSKPFNPYHKWLGIRDGQSPPNHYRLLGLELWESDEDVIRDAYSRQMNHVRHFSAGPQRDVCRRILDELLAARDTLLDSHLRNPYDRWLKVVLSQAGQEGAAGQLPRQPFAVHAAHRPSAMASTPAAVECASCGTENASTRKFCSGCGVALWEPCIECGVLYGPGDVHCGSCGANLATAIQRRTEDFQNRLNTALELQSEGAYDKAIDLLEETLLHDHPRLAAHRDRAEQMIGQAKAEIERAERLAETALADAENLRQQGDFEQAAVVLERLPSHLLTEPMQQLLNLIREQQIEVLTTVAEIQQALNANQLDGLLAKVERLLQLQPNNAQALKLQSRLQQLEDKRIEARRSKLCKLALEEVERRNYTRATNLLEQISTEHRTPEIVKLLDKVSIRAAESNWLRSDLRDAVVYDELLLSIAERLLKLHPEDAVATKAIESLRQQAKLSPAERLNKKFVWPSFPAKSHWGFPIGVVRAFQRIDVDLSQSAVASDPQSYCVAAGLALQGLDRAALETNLAPREKTSILGRLKVRKRMNAAAWGIDLGHSSLKAVKLAYQPATDRVMIVDSVLIPIDAEASQSIAESAEAIQRAPKSLLDQKPMTDCAVCVGFPAQKTLMRFFSVPRIDCKKTDEIMQYEVKQQIPVPLETMAWDYQVVNSDESRDRSEPLIEDEIALFAAKLEDVQAQLKTFADLGIKVDFLQSDCAALYNFLAYERFPKDAAKQESALGQESVIAMLDIGADSSNLIVSDSKKMFMRSIFMGGNQITRALCGKYNLAWKQAEELKRNPMATATALHRLYETIEPKLQNLAAEIQKTFEQYSNQHDDSASVTEMAVIGGGAKLHGLLKYLALGRS
jgi:type IV pilus assembly protein PilM